MSSPSPVAPWRWTVVWLLFLATMLNYMDRLALSSAQEYILAEFEPDPAKQNKVYGDIQYAFGVAFALFQVVAGFLIDRFSLRWLYLGAIVVWSAAGVATGLVPAGAVAALAACRVVLGVGEAFNWPCAVACIRRVIPRESRGLANGIFHSGASIGAVATPALVVLAVNPATGAGWRALFVAVGAVGAVWAVVWVGATRGARAAAIDGTAAGEPAPVPFAAVFARRMFWVCLATGVCVNLCWHVYNQWFPRYLTQDLGLKGAPVQYVLAGFFVAADLGSMASGWATRRLVRAGRTVERSRQVVMTGLAAAVAAATVPAALLPADEYFGAKVGAYFVVAAAAVGGFAVFFALAQDIVPQHTAKILGVCGCASWLVISGVTKAIGEFGLVGPGRYAGLFLAVGAVPLAAAAAGWLWPRAAR